MRLWWSRVDRGVAVLIILYLCSLPLVAHRMTASDAIEYYVYDRSVYFDHDLDFTNDYAGFLRPQPERVGEIQRGFHRQAQPRRECDQ